MSPGLEAQASRWATGMPVVHVLRPNRSGPINQIKPFLDIPPSFPYFLWHFLQKVVGFWQKERIFWLLYGNYS
jgi:hypothetical protein